MNEQFPIPKCRATLYGKPVTESKPVLLCVSVKDGHLAAFNLDTVIFDPSDKAVTADGVQFLDDRDEVIFSGPLIRAIRIEEGDQFQFAPGALLVTMFMRS